MPVKVFKNFSINQRCIFGINIAFSLLRSTQYDPNYPAMDPISEVKEPLRDECDKKSTRQGC